MAIIRAYTTIEQSRKLAEILPLESADMFYCYGMDIHTKKCGYDTVPTIIDADNQIDICDIPCWSLATLLSVLPYCPDLSKHTDGKWYITTYPNDVHTCLIAYDNPIDACVAMIEKLHEFKML